MARMQAGQVYRWRMVQASTMKWMDLSLNGTGCQWGLYSRDGNFLRSFPRMTHHIVMSAANRRVHPSPDPSQKPFPPWGCHASAVLQAQETPAAPHKAATDSLSTCKHRMAGFC